MPGMSAARQNANGRVISAHKQDDETLAVLHQLGLGRLTPYAHALQPGQSSGRGAAELATCDLRRPSGLQIRANAACPNSIAPHTHRDCLSARR